MPWTISADEARNRPGTWLGYVSDNDDEVIVESEGKPKALPLSIEAFEEVQELREKQRRAAALERLYAIRDERERKGILTRPAEIDPERRAEAVRNLRALRDEMGTQNNVLV